MRWYKRSTIKRMLCAALVLGIVPLSGCYDMREPDDLAYVIAVGVDAGGDGEYLYTFQYANPLKFSSSEGGGGGGGEGEQPESIESITVKASTLFSALGDTENYLSKQTTFMHLRLIVYSEELAQEGIGDEFMEFMRNADLHPNTILAISAVGAQEYLKSVAPPLEANPLKHYDMLFNKTFQAFSPSTTIREFFYDSKAPDRQAVAIYVGVTQNKEVEDLNNLVGHIDILGEDDEMMAEGHKQLSDFKTEVLGTAVFRDAAMVGKIGSVQTKFYQMLSGSFSSGIFTIEAPQQPDKRVTARIQLQKDPRFDISIQDGLPKIKVTLYLTGEFLSMPDAGEEAGQTQLYNQRFGELIAQGAKALADKTAQDYQADIFGFGKKFRRFFTTWDEWEAYGWRDKYPKATFEVETEIKIETSGTVIYEQERTGGGDGS